MQRGEEREKERDDANVANNKPKGRFFIFIRGIKAAQTGGEILCSAAAFSHKKVDSPTTS